MMPQVAPSPGERVTSRILREVGSRLPQGGVEGPFFPDWEFHSVIRRERSEVAEVSDEWPSTSVVARQRLAVGKVRNRIGIRWTTRNGASVHLHNTG